MVGYDAIAPGLRVGVAVERIKEASRQLDAMIRRPRAPSSGDRHWEGIEEDGRTLLAMNRLAAMIEDSLHLLQADDQNQTRGKRDFSGVIRFGLTRAVKCIRQMHETMKGMAVSARRLARSSEPRTRNREIAAKRAAFYTSLLRRPELLKGTGFERVLLSTALEKLRGTSAGPTGGQDQPKEEP